MLMWKKTHLKKVQAMQETIDWQSERAARLLSEISQLTVEAKILRKRLTKYERTEDNGKKDYE